MIRQPSERRQDPPAGRGRRDRGQSLVETAIVVPILLLLLAAVVDFGRAFDAYIVLTNAAREGARFATLRYPPPSVEAVRQLVAEDVQGSGTNISYLSGFVISDVTMISTMSAATVTVSYDFNLWFGGLIGLDSVRLTKQAVMPAYVPGD